MKKYLFVSLAILVIAGVIFAGCGSPATPTTSEIRIGAPIQLTGELAAMGQGSDFALKAAVEDINKLGGVYVADLGKKLPVKLITVDEQSNPIKAGTLAENLILTDKVNFLSGMLTPPESATVAPVADKYNVPFVFSEGPFEPYNAMRSASNPPWQYTWAIGFAIATPAPEGDFRAGQPGYTILGLEAEVLKQFVGQTNKKVAIFASDDPDGRGWYDGAAHGLPQAGLTVIGADKELGMAPLNTTDFSSVISEWKANGAEMLWGMAPAPWFGTLWRQSHEMGFKPKMVWAAKAGLYNQDVLAWGGDLANGVMCELWWYPTYQNSPGIGDTTPQSLYDRWVKATNTPLNQGIGTTYAPMQVLFKAIETAGSLDPDKVNAALAQTDMYTIAHRVVFDKQTHFSRQPVFLIQWQKTDKPWKYNAEVIVSQFSFIPQTAQPLFPIP